MAQKIAAAGRNTPQRGGHRLDITVWQFVRIMVQLEAVSRSRGGRRRASQPVSPERPVYLDWRAAWQEIDHELTRLASTDAEGFSDLMMNQNVVLECRNRSQINEVARAIDNVVHQMRAEVTASVGDEAHITDLRFEIREMEKLTKKLSGVGRKKVTRPAAKPAAAQPSAENPSAAKPEGKPAGKPADRAVARSSTGKPIGGKLRGDGPRSGKPSGQAAERPVSRSPTGKPLGGKPRGDKPRTGKPSGGKFAAGKPFGKAAARTAGRASTGTPSGPAPGRKTGAGPAAQPAGRGGKGRQRRPPKR